MSEKRLNATDIITAYTMGSIDLEEANRRLADMGAGFRLDPDRCRLTEEMIANGWGLLDTGTGSYDPVQVRCGELVDNDMGNMPARVCLRGVWHEVKGRKVMEE